MTIQEALNKGARISNGDKWLCAEDFVNGFIVYERPYHAKKNKVLIETINLDTALNVLMAD